MNLNVHLQALNLTLINFGKFAPKNFVVHREIEVLIKTNIFVLDR
jgi:hypothetical protein